MTSTDIFFQKNNLTIINNDILKTKSISRNSIDLIITSPPYNVDIHYNKHKDDLDYSTYLEFSQKWINRCYDLTKDDGRFCLNIPLDKNKGGKKSVYADFVKICKEIGWQYHTTIIWNEGNISRRTAWGSWLSASAPYVIAPVEMILVLYKKDWRKISGTQKSTISKDEFMPWTNGMWTFNGESKKRIGHPAPFPLELPDRCIKLFSFEYDTILDPFVGSGTTLISAFKNKRNGIGVDYDKSYCKLAQKRIEIEAFIQTNNMFIN